MFQVLITGEKIFGLNDFEVLRNIEKVLLSATKKQYEKIKEIVKEKEITKEITKENKENKEIVKENKESLLSKEVGNEIFEWLNFELSKGIKKFERFHIHPNSGKFVVMNFYEFYFNDLVKEIEKNVMEIKINFDHKIDKKILQFDDNKIEEIDFEDLDLLFNNNLISMVDQFRSFEQTIKNHSKFIIGENSSMMKTKSINEKLLEIIIDFLIRKEIFIKKRIIKIIEIDKWIGIDVNNFEFLIIC